MITVHHLNNSRSQRVLWLLEELEVPYEVIRHERDAKTMLAPPSLLAIHPLGKSPVITDGELMLAESGAITEYLIGRYGNGRLIPPAGTAERLRYTYWLHYAEGSAMPPLVMRLIFSRLAKPPVPALVRPVAKLLANGVLRSYLNPQIARHLEYMESELRKSTWFAGEELTGADIQMSFPLEAAAARVGFGSAHSGLAKFLERVHSRPAYQRALEHGGKYDLLR